jgi:hypothetical protein
MTSRHALRARLLLWLPLVAAFAPPAAAQDPCLLTLTEARELAGSDISQAGGDGRRCTYAVPSGESRLEIEIDAIASEAARARLEELGDAARFDSRQKGRVTYWLSRGDELAGWVRRGERLASLRSAGAASAKRRRLLEHALQRVGERLR